MKHNSVLKQIAILSLSLFLAKLCPAAENRPLIAAQDATPIRVITPESLKAPIEIASMAIDADIYGGFAQTQIEFRFYNPNSEAVAADFIFPIPQHSTMDGYSLDVNGVMVDGVIVEKHKGRVTFEKITRQNIDPGLLEKIEGNIFRTRIFPIAPQSSRTIKLHYFTKLMNFERHSNYVLPFIHNTNISHFNIELNAIDINSKPKFVKSQLPNLEFNRWQQGYRTSYSANDIKLSQNLWLDIPKFSSGKALISNSKAETSFFAINHIIEQQADDSQSTYSEVDLIWDTSHSRKQANHLLEFELLDKLFKKLSVKKVNLYLLRNSLSSSKSFELNKNKSSLFNTLKRLNYDGGTDFSTLSSLPAASGNTRKAIFIFSDGQDTFGKKELPLLNSPTYLFSTNQVNNPAFSQRLANQNGGDYYYLSRQESITPIINLVGKPKTQLTKIHVIEGKANLMPKLPIPLNHEPLLLTGKLESKKVSLELVFEFQGKVIKKQQLTITKEDRGTGELAQKLWAQQQIKQLLINKTSNKDKITQLSKDNNLVTDFTSLIVLESLEQYLEHAIVPPKSLPDMRKDYFSELKNHVVPEASKEEHLEKVVRLWQNRKDWWNTKYPLPRKKIEDKANTKSLLFRRVPRMAPPTNPQEQRDTEEEVVVTTGSRISTADLMSSESEVTESNISLPQWQANANYLTTLKATVDNKRLEKYYQLKSHHAESPAFYFDVAALFFEQGQDKIGLQVLSNIAELKLQDSRMLRTMAMRLKQFAYLNLAIETYQTVLILRPEEPQSYRDLALALALRGLANDNKKEIQRAIKLLYQVVSKPWDRFEGIQVTAITELNRLLTKLDIKKYKTTFIDPRLLDNLPVNLRIVSSWDTDLTDIDLWVIEPSGEKVTFDNTLSKFGGKFHKDYTDGYGPEEYLLKKAPKGKYKIKVHYYGNSSPEISGAVTLFIDVFTNYASGKEQKRTMTLRLEKADEDYLVGEITI